MKKSLRRIRNALSAEFAVARSNISSRRSGVQRSSASRYNTHGFLNGIDVTAQFWCADQLSKGLSTMRAPRDLAMCTVASVLKESSTTMSSDQDRLSRHGPILA